MGRLHRRTFLQAGAATGATYLFSGAAGAPRAVRAPRANDLTRPRVYVLVVEGCRPGEINSAQTPRLASLREVGRNFPRARSLPIMETLPNHATMMTGVFPDRHGVPANSVYDRREEVVRDLDRPADLHYPTVLERLRGHGLTTATVLSTEYLSRLFGTRATHRWAPQPVIPVSGHARDVSTMDAAIAIVEQFDPNLVFVTLSDCDRVGHSDLTGTTLGTTRNAALLSVDTQVGRFVDMLEETGRWRSAVLMVLAGHSMDWSTPERLVSLAPALNADPLLSGRVQIAQNGGADLLYWTGSRDHRDEAVGRIRRIAMATEGVLSVHAGPELHLGARAGDVVAFCQSGWRFSDPAPYSHPVPGNHGHPATAPIPFFLAGGSPLVAAGTSSTASARTIDVAPSVGRIFGLSEPRGGYDGRARI